MGWCIRLSLVLFLGFLLSFNSCFAATQKIKYSIGPKCNENNVVCGQNEVPVCLVLEPSIHLVSSNSNDPTKDVKYIPSCGTVPTCTDTNGLPAPDNVVLECIEFVQCQDETAYCSDGKTAKCFGNDNELKGCNCKDGSSPVCDYIWEISNVGTYD